MVEIKKRIMDSLEVKEQVDKLFKNRVKSYEGTMHIRPSDEKLLSEINKDADKIMVRIISNYNHTTLRLMA
jgi:hypothetical protein